MAKILFVAKDNGCASVTEQVAVMARKDGHTVICALEGLAMKRYETLGFPIHEPPNYAGVVNFKEPKNEEEARIVRSFSVANLFGEIRPDIIVTGLGSPINIQAQIAEEATRRGIPLVVCEDFWSKSPGHLEPSKVKPTFILTVDEYSVELSKPFFGGAEYHIVGNPGVKEVEVSEGVRAQMDALKKEYDGVCVYAGGGPESILSELHLLMQCIEKTRGKWCVIPGFHPKYDKEPSPQTGKSYGEVWREFLAPFGDRVQFVKASTDQIAVCADLVASGFSTIMSTAVFKGVPAVCLNTQATRDALNAHGAHYEGIIPQVVLGIAPEVTETEPSDISWIRLPSREVLQKIIPYDAKMAYEHINKLARSECAYNRNIL